ncbi:MAG: sigma-70 family RNA polymerase sigma factor [Acidaminobacter sp.]|uniref:sigma-70 family RNA polymerase sigma factor n=1 Tax=Acidaminobacter sp. TaxID=1872102 RepID=UPI00137F4D91|nr:sigma-70 family RNA polymerase sigma factor [Acidaminobacter sp.]MZQ97622.1 sigma-70 family RNA polymerase sigma factor [Acidaminobacter sp.]
MSENEALLSLDEAAQRYFVRLDDESLKTVMQSAEKLIRYYAHLYGKGCDRDDLTQTGYLGLMKALKGYDQTKEASFATYASHCIMGEIRHLVRKQASYYRPGCIVELQGKVDRVMDEYLRDHGEAASVKVIAEKLKVRESAIEEVMKAGLVSFDEIDTSKIHSTEYESFRLPIEDRIVLAQAMKRLSDLQRKVIQMLFFQDLSQQEVADRTGLTQKKVSRIRKESLERMGEELNDDVVEEPIDLKTVGEGRGRWVG